MPSSLTSPAPPGSPLPKDRANDWLSAARTWLIEAAIDGEDVLKPSPEPLDIDVVVDARSAKLDRSRKNVPDRVVKPASCRLAQPLCAFRGTDPRLPQRLAGVDVPDPGDPALIEEEGFDRGSTPG